MLYEMTTSVRFCLSYDCFNIELKLDFFYVNRVKPVGGTKIP